MWVARASGTVGVWWSWTLESPCSGGPVAFCTWVLMSLFVILPLIFVSALAKYAVSIVGRASEWNGSMTTIFRCPFTLCVWVPIVVFCNVAPYLGIDAYNSVLLAH